MSAQPTDLHQAQRPELIDRDDGVSELPGLQAMSQQGKENMFARVGEETHAASNNRAERLLQILSRLASIISIYIYPYTTLPCTYRRKQTRRGASEIVYMKLLSNTAPLHPVAAATHMKAA